MLVEPAILDGLASAEAAMDTVHGRAVSGWQVASRSKLTLTVEVPPNTTGEIWVPTRFGGIAAPSGAQAVRPEPGYAATVYRTGPGRFIFNTGGTPMITALYSFRPAAVASPVAAQQVTIDSGVVARRDSRRRRIVQGHSLCGGARRAIFAGARRRRSPRGAAPRDATAYGPDCMQNPLPGNHARTTRPMSEDCLTLNVWTPKARARRASCR